MPTPVVSSGSPIRQSPPLRVLLVEDFPELAEVTAELLAEEGLDVRTALSGREALEIAPGFQPQLVLCDLYLPDMEGLEVIRELRSMPSTARSCIAVLTAMLETDFVECDSKQLGVDAFLSKPITIEALEKFLAEAGQRERHLG